MEWTAGGCRNGQVNDEHIGTFREFDEPRVGAILIGAENGRYAACLHTICESWYVGVRYPDGGHGQTLLVEHGERLRLRHIGVSGIETKALRVRLPDVHRRAEHLECAIPLVEETAEKRRKGRSRIVTRGANDAQRLRAKIPARPQKRRQVGDVVGMQMADGGKSQVGEVGPRLAETQEGA